MEKAPKKYHTFGTVPKSRRKIVKRGKIDILNYRNLKQAKIKIKLIVFS
jgi:hypothetical protein